MNPAYISVFLLLFVVMMSRRERAKKAFVKKTILSKDKKEKKYMFELAKTFIGMECVVYTLNSEQLTGVIKEVSEGAILLEKGQNRQIVNLDYITRIREYPKDKKGKKKSVIFD